MSIDINKARTPDERNKHSPFSQFGGTYMLHIDPRLTGIFIILFLALGLFNIYMSSKRIKAQQQRGEKAHWYSNVTYLTGLEYALLAIVLAINLGITVGIFPIAWGIAIIPAYLLVLLLAALVMLVIIYQSVIVAGRRRRQKMQAEAESSATHESTTTTSKSELSPEQRARKRDRRRKAAAARRRQSGRA
jgi:succinate dehydrogenase/fumarate reductase cytochrome b subunit